MSENINQSNMNRMPYNYNQSYTRNDLNNQRQNMNNQMNPQVQNMNMNQNQPQNMMMQNQRANLQMTNQMTNPMNENSEFIKNIQNILKQPHSEERTENLGEVIFYYLLDFIPKYKLNVTQGQFDDTILCSKLTGILIHEDDQEIIDIVSNTENLLIFIKNVIMVILIFDINLFFILFTYYL